MSSATLLDAEKISHFAPRVPAAYQPGRIVNTYCLASSEEQKELGVAIRVRQIRMQTRVVDVSIADQRDTVRVGQSVGGWKLVAILPWHNGWPTAVFERHVSHTGAIAFINEERELTRIPKYIGQLSNIRPRDTHNPHGMKFTRQAAFRPGPDVLGKYLLDSSEDPCYENVAALGPEFIGWSLVSDDGVGAEKSLWLEPDGTTRQLTKDPQALWAPDAFGRLFEPAQFLPKPYLYTYIHGYSKRTMLGGFLPVANTGVWNPVNKVGYEVTMVLSAAGEHKPIARIRGILPSDITAPFHAAPNATLPLISDGEFDRYWNGSAEEFYTSVLGVWERWTTFFSNGMEVEIPDAWLTQAAKAGIVLARCSYRGLEPTYQIGEGAYTKIPERSHALFPVAHYEVVWAQQLWSFTRQVEPHFQFYLNRYIQADGNFVYCTQDQVEAPLNVGVFLANSARAYDYAHDLAPLRERLPPLRRAINFVMMRREFTKRTFPLEDPRHGLIWGSPEADNGDPDDDTPEAHLYYYQNAAWIWRGLTEHARSLRRAGTENSDPALVTEGAHLSEQARELRIDIERSLRRTLADRNSDMKAAGITPFSAFDTQRKPHELTSYENHRYMMDWWTCDWGDQELDAGHFRHRTCAGLEVLGMNVASDGVYAVDSGSLVTSNFMEHGTLAARIRLEDYRPFLLTLYGNLCFAMDSGNRFASEDAVLPGSFAGEGRSWTWSSVVNSVLQPTLALKWLLCYEEHESDIVHLQKAAPKHWFAIGQRIVVKRCATRFGLISWSTEAVKANGQPSWRIALTFPESSLSRCTLVFHIHPADSRPLRSSSLGKVAKNTVTIPHESLEGKQRLIFEVT